MEHVEVEVVVKGLFVGDSVYVRFGMGCQCGMGCQRALDEEDPP